MSSRAYQKIYEAMTEHQKSAMYNLYMRGTSHDGHTWVTYSDVENMVVSLLTHAPSHRTAKRRVGGNWGRTHWYECSNCGCPVDQADNYCKACGVELED